MSSAGNGPVQFQVSFIMHPAAEIIDILEVKQANAAAGQYHFTPGNMRFFNSRLSTSAIKFNRVAMFVTSERQPSIAGKIFPRLYTACMMPLNGERWGYVRHLEGTEFQQFKSSKAAWAAIDAYCAAEGDAK